MIEQDLRAAAARLDVPVPEDLVPSVLARLDAPETRRARLRRRPLLAGAVAALVAVLGLTPQGRAFAADLLDAAGIHLGSDEPSAPVTPRAPLPGSGAADLEEARRSAAFPVTVPVALGVPDRVTVADGARVVTLTWTGPDGTVVLDEFDGTLDPVFEKQVGGVAVSVEEVDGRRAWWIDGPHDVTYVPRDGVPASATARLAGNTLVWQSTVGVTYRLEGESLNLPEALRIARSLPHGTGTGGARAG